MTHDEQIKVIEEDLRGKLFRRDWRGVIDCAADLRELEAKEKGRKEGILLVRQALDAKKLWSYPPSKNV